ncbi:hypothetical protein [Streptomyces sp. NPDC087300]|uniref:hypothetical protein n=1 Tax=Streptomyces sp. NPDC087300 TaxID=3365780 RepID=UPI00382530C9
MRKTPLNRVIFGRTSALLAMITAGAIFATSAAAHASDIQAPRLPNETSAASTIEGVRHESGNALSDAEIEELLGLLAAIPDEVLEQGEDATLAYLNTTHSGLTGPNRLKLPSLECVSLVGAAVAGALIPASKVVKLAMIAKRYSVKRVASAVLGIRKGLGKKYPNDLKDAALILLGVDKIKTACS